MCKKLNSNLGISLTSLSGRILIYRTTLAALDWPEYVRVLLDVKRRKMAVQVCSIDDPGANKVTIEESEVKKDYRITSKCLFDMIYAVCGWDTEKSYSCRGKLIEEHNLVEFELDFATIIFSRGKED